MKRIPLILAFIAMLSFLQEAAQEKITYTFAKNDEIKNGDYNVKGEIVYSSDGIIAEYKIRISDATENIMNRDFIINRHDNNYDIYEKDNWGFVGTIRTDGEKAYYLSESNKMLGEFIFKGDDILLQRPDGSLFYSFTHSQNQIIFRSDAPVIINYHGLKISSYQRNNGNIVSITEEGHNRFQAIYLDDGGRQHILIEANTSHKGRIQNAINLVLIMLTNYSIILPFVVGVY